MGGRDGGESEKMMVVVYNNDLEGAIRAWKKKMRQSAINAEIGFREKWPSHGERERAKRHRAWKRRKKAGRKYLKF
jgi:ribosomal protein S21